MVDLNARERYKVSTMGQVVDHYQTLQIEQGSSVEDVKRAFRTLAKRYHPDKNPGQEEAAEQMFRRITTAYQILSDEQQRMLYDLTLDQPKAEHNPYLERLRQTQVRRKRCELMFQELLNHNINEGIRIYEELRSQNPDFSIDKFLEYADSRDCEFLLAEAYQAEGLHSHAIELYQKLIDDERKNPFFFHFIDEINERLSQIYYEALMNPQNLEDIPVYLEKIQTLKLSKRNLGWIYKKLAEYYLDCNLPQDARRMVETAININPKIAGIGDLCRLTGIKR